MYTQRNRLDPVGLNGIVNKGRGKQNQLLPGMPNILSGSGASSADIYYEVRGDTPSTSGRYGQTLLSNPLKPSHNPHS